MRVHPAFIATFAALMVVATGCGDDKPVVLDPTTTVAATTPAPTPVPVETVDIAPMPPSPVPQPAPEPAPAPLPPAGPRPPVVAPPPPAAPPAPPPPAPAPPQGSGTAAVATRSASGAPVAGVSIAITTTKKCSSDFPQDDGPKQIVGHATTGPDGIAAVLLPVGCYLGSMTRVPVGHLPKPAHNLVVLHITKPNETATGVFGFFDGPTPPNTKPLNGSFTVTMHETGKPIVGRSIALLRCDNNNITYYTPATDREGKVKVSLDPRAECWKMTGLFDNVPPPCTVDPQTLYLKPNFDVTLYGRHPDVGVC